jgi:hypothetical protein
VREGGREGEGGRGREREGEGGRGRKGRGGETPPSFGEGAGISSLSSLQPRLHLINCFTCLFVLFVYLFIIINMSSPRSAPPSHQRFIWYFHDQPQQPPAAP